MVFVSGNSTVTDLISISTMSFAIKLLPLKQAQHRSGPSSCKARVNHRLAARDTPALSRRRLRRNIEAGAFLHAAGVDAAIADDWRGPAFAIEHLGAGDFFVTRRRRFDQNELALVTQHQQMAVHQDQVARAKPWFAPHLFARRQFDAFERGRLVLL